MSRSLVPGGTAARLARMRWWDIVELMPLEQQLFNADAWPAETFWSELAAPGRAYWVARDQERGAREPVLGYAGVAINRPTADIQTIAVATAAQGTGLGRRLLARLLEHAHCAGAAEVFLEVRADNAPAQRLYAAGGFTAVGVRRGYYQPGGIDAIVMRLRPLTAPPQIGHGAPSTWGDVIGHVG